MIDFALAINWGNPLFGTFIALFIFDPIPGGSCVVVLHVIQHIQYSKVEGLYNVIFTLDALAESLDLDLSACTRFQPRKSYPNGVLTTY